MENHYYQIGGKIYRQKEGSAIGVDLSVESCSLYMTNWDKMFLDKLKRLCITVNLYFRYVDDIVIGLRGIHHGWYYSTLLKKMIFDADRVPVLPGDQHTFFQLQLIANSLDSDIQLTVDTPSQNESGQLPVLDLGLSVVNNKICHTFYSKPMSSPYQIHFRSAMAKRTKRETLLQEGIRRLRNIGPSATDLDRNTLMSTYMNSLRISGYDQSFRYHTLRGIFNLHSKHEEEIALGNRVRYRSREEIINLKAKKIGKYPATWFLRGNVQNTLKVQATPNSGLTSALKSALGGQICAEGGETKFIELGGKPVYSGLSGTELFTANSGCVFEKKCNIDPMHDCRVSRAVYETECTICKNSNIKSVYYGTSGRMLHLRQREHMTDIRLLRRNNAMFKHTMNAHPNLVPDYMSRPVQGGFKYNVDRFIFEALKIQQGNQDATIQILNSRAEWGHRGLPRLQVNLN